MVYCRVNGLECSECTPCCGSRKSTVDNEKYIKQLEQSIKYFEAHKKFLASVNLQGQIALNIAIDLIEKELNKTSEIEMVADGKKEIKK